MDLPDAQSDSDFPRSQPWRVHFHVPIHRSTLLDERLTTTRNAIEQALDVLTFRQDIRPHLEIETYTWHALPEAERPKNLDELCHGITAEFTWLEQAMMQRQLLDNPA